MPHSEPIIRQEHLHGLPHFCLNLAEALKRIVPDKVRLKAAAGAGHDRKAPESD
jgi:hypothetical protein